MYKSDKTGAPVNYLDEGNIEKLIKQQLKIKKRERKTTCPVCGSEIREGEGLHLEFGSPRLRKKATFDGADCMQYFIEHKLKQKNKINKYN